MLIAIIGGCTGTTAAPETQAPDVPASSQAERQASPPARATAAPAESPATPERTVEASGGFRLAALSSASCTAEGPADWTMQAPERSDRADLLSPDGSMYAGYGIQAVNTALQGYASVYEPPLNDPALYSDDPAVVALGYGRIIVSALGGSPDLAVEETVEPFRGYLLSVVSSSTHAGAVVFHASGYPGDGVNYSYALPMYFAFATRDRWSDQGLLVARVAASIRCSTQFQPPDDYPIVEAAAAGAAGDDNGDEAGYNPQLGTEAVNDPSTGENYLVDPSLNWSDTGPDGPGYYVQKGGGDYQKLEPGRVD